MTVARQQSSGAERATAFRVGYLLYEFPTLSQTFVFNEVRAGLELGRDIRVISLRRPRAAESRLLGQLPPDRVQFASIAGRKARRVWSYAHDTLREIADRPASMRALLTSRYGSLRQRTSLFAISRRCGRVLKGLDVLHCHFGPLGLIGAALKDMGVTRAKLVTSFHGFDLSSSIDQHGRGYYKLLFEQGDL